MVQCGTRKVFLGYRWCGERCGKPKHESRTLQRMAVRMIVGGFVSQQHGATIWWLDDKNIFSAIRLWLRRFHTGRIWTLYWSDLAQIWRGNFERVQNCCEHKESIFLVEESQEAFQAGWRNPNATAAQANLLSSIYIHIYIYITIHITMCIWYPPEIHLWRSSKDLHFHTGPLARNPKSRTLDWRLKKSS